MSNSSGIIMQEQTPIKTRVFQYLLGFIPLFYLGILCGACSPASGNLFDLIKNFEKFIIEEHHFIVGFTSSTPMYIMVFEVIWSLAFLYYTAKFDHPFAGQEYGNAKWGEIKRFTKLYGNHDASHEIEVNFGDVKPPENPVYVNTHNYWLAEGVYLSIDNKRTSNLNVLVFGPPGTGKSFRLCRPVLSSLSGNYFVTDPKGELSKQCSQFLEDNGYEVLIFNCESSEGMKESIHFNPFRYLREEEDLTLLTDILFKATTPPGESSDPFFEGKAKGLLLDAFYLMFFTYEKQDQDWRHFVELIDSMGITQDKKTGGIDNSDENCIYQRFLKANEKWKNGDYTDGVPQEDNLKGFIDIRDMYNGAFETTSGIIESLKNHTKDMKYDSVIDLLSDDDIDIVNNFVYCKKNKYSPTGKRCLFLVTSETKRQYDWITSMIYYFAIDTCYHYCTVDPSLNETLPEHLTFLMDECNNITLPSEFVDWLSTMRSRGMSCICVWQDLHQIKGHYPDNDQDESYKAKFSVVIVLGGSDPKADEELSKYFGKTTIHKQTTGETFGIQGSSSANEDVMERMLCPPDVISNIDKDGFMPIYIRNTDPLWARKCQLEHNPLYPLLTRRTKYKVREKIKISNDRIDRNRSPCEQLPELLVGDDAVKFLKQCKDEGVKVITVTEKDIDAMETLFKYKVDFKGHDPTTKEYWNQLHKQSDEVIRNLELNAINYDEYTKDEVMIIQKLRNVGFSYRQINALSPLIHKEFSFEKILECFGVRLSIDEIDEFVNRMLKFNNESEVLV